MSKIKTIDELFEGFAAISFIDSRLSTLELLNDRTRLVRNPGPDWIRVEINLLDLEPAYHWVMDKGIGQFSMTTSKIHFKYEDDALYFKLGYSR